MEQIIVTKSDLTTWDLTQSAVITRAEQKRTLLGEDIVIMSVDSYEKLDLAIKDSIKIFGSTYVLNSLPQHKKTGSRKFHYELSWEGNQYELLKVQYQFDVDDTDSIYSDFPLTGNLQAFAELLITNLERVYPGKYSLGTCPETDTVTETFANENCLQILQTLCSEEKFNKEFELVEDESGNVTINIADTIGQTILTTYRYGKGKQLYELERKNASNKNIITRLYAFGSQRNLSSDYRGYSQRLKLPGIEKSYIEDTSAKAIYGHIEGTKIFEDIFPHRTGTVTSLGSSVTRFGDSSMDFDLKADDGNGNTLYLIPETTPKIHFNTGNLAGYEFEVVDYDHDGKTFLIKAFRDERGQAFPDSSSSAFQLAVGDEYVLIDIMMPQSYIDAAEAELLSAAESYLLQNCQPRVQYSFKINKTYLEDLFSGEAIANPYNIGDSLNIQDADIGVDKSIRIRSFTRNILDPYEYTNIDLNDINEKGLLQRVIASTIETEKALAMNNLKDPARAMRNWKTTRELLDMIFDPDGYFNGEKINPETIETIMISVGSRSQQFALSVKIEANYQGDPEAVNIGAGVLAHFGIEETIRLWNISGGSQDLTSSGSLYIYAKCETGSPGGVILFSEDQIKVDDQANYYHFLIGILHQAEDNVRWISLTYGSTVINGAFIRTGRIQSQTGLCYFDLEAEEIGGRIRFSSGTTDEEIEEEIIDAQDAAEAAALVAASKKRHFHIQPFTPYDIGDLWTTGNNLYRCIVTRLTGSYQSGDWALATTYDNTKTIIDGGLITTGRVEVGAGTLGQANAGISGVVSANPDTDVRLWGGATFTNRASAPFRVLQNGNMFASLGQIAGWIIAADALYRGTKKTSNGYSLDGITIAGDGSIHAKNFYINADGVCNMAGLELPHLTPKAASTNLRHSNDTQESLSNAAWQKVKGIKFTNGLLGTIRVSFDFMKTETVSGAAYIEVRRNGTAIGTRQTADLMWDQFIENITQTWAPGDSCELWVYSASGVTVIVRSFRIYYDNNPTVAVASENE